MIALLKVWLFLIIIFQHHIFMKYINYYSEDNQSFIDNKIFITMFYITLLYLSANAKTTYQTILRLVVLIFFSPIILFLHF